MAATRASYFDFVQFMEQFRRQENNERATTLNEQVEILLSSNGQSTTKILTMDQPPSGETEFLVFDALVARKETACLGFCSTFDASCLSPLISRIEKGTLASVTLGGMPLSGSLATKFFEKMLYIGLRRFTLFLREDYGSEVIRPFLHYLQESSVSCLSLWCPPCQWISMETLQSICTGILNSSVKEFIFSGIKVRGGNVKRAHEILAEMLLDSSSSIETIQVDPDVPADITLQLLSHALRQHPGVQNLDVSFRFHTLDDQDDMLVFDRNPWWKRCLAMDHLPLNLWPLVLEKADTLKRDASHSHLDVLNYLLREKNTELLQNVRRRRIRKRKRYGFSA